MVSDEEAAKIRKRLKEDCCSLPGGYDDFGDEEDVYCEEAEGYIEALLDTREAVIAWLEKEIGYMEEAREGFKPGKFPMSYYGGRLVALIQARDHIRNPKEADGSQPTADSEEEK